MKDIIQTEDAPRAIGPYSQAVKISADSMLFCSGQIPIDPATGQVVEGPAEVQARQVMENVKAVVEAAGLSLEDVVKTTIYLKDLSSFGAVNGVYESFFQGDYPARSTVEVSALPRGVLVEIDAVACR